MVLLSNIIGGATFGFTARALAVALQGRPVFQKFGGLAAWTVTGGLVGFGYFHAQQSQLQKIEQRRKELLEKREIRRNKEAAEN
ncbi:hypothetical protein H4219_001547 [Mycoemilia scoparia]|uniref:Uncharacterized protein n=1 Tax=Mycoemilia scoparia TaxID=417184 RepID=A0A9W8A4N0_9FUNG|nr:hypothetical protein H4219_001547 [Mycoemilia scoparia]